MNTRSRARNGNGGVGDLDGNSEHAPKEKSNNHSAAGGKNVVGDLESRKSKSEL
ncbi:UNVERIFIED_CONTAM: hypothetical protein Slati_0921700 [Sesamum latifolium]|uniref:Uncharacterized protein n=1 Tax=Sesamum latifolium TaxID=2727402 RepID=A0AAW2XQK7_9LAMI